MKQGKGETFGQQWEGTPGKSEGTVLWTAGIGSSWGMKVALGRARQISGCGQAQAVVMLRRERGLMVLGQCQDSGWGYTKGPAVA